jgi:hypothetical protein
MATSQETLAMHPSVQDLDMDLTKVNPRKVHYHKLVINSGPLHEPSDHGRNSLVKKNVPKGQTVTITRNDANLKAAARALLVPSEIGGRQGIIPPAPTVKKSAGGAPPPLLSPVSASSGSPLGASAGSQGVVKRPSSINGTNHNKGFKLTSDKLAGLSTTASSQDGHLPIPLPPVLGASTSSNRAGPPAPRRASSIVSSKVSFAATDAESFSMYSCSCCHVRPPSSYVGNASEYDNLTSVSQRPSNHTSVASISSTKLRKLEDDLKKEREDRLKTQHDLSVIQQRQMLLLSKLSDDERRKLEALVLEVK